MWLAVPIRHCEQSMYRCIHFAEMPFMPVQVDMVLPADDFQCQLQSCLLDHPPPNCWYCKRLGTQKNQWDPFTMIRSWFLSPACGNSSRNTQCVTGRTKSRSQANEVPLYLFYRNVIHVSTSRSGTANE